MRNEKGLQKRSEWTLRHGQVCEETFEDDRVRSKAKKKTVIGHSNQLTIKTKKEILMERKDYQYIEMLGRVVEFGEAHTELFPKDTFSGEAFSALGAMLTEFSGHANAHMSSRKAGRDNRRAKLAAREGLIQQLLRVGNTAAAISIDTPIVHSKFRVMRQDRRRDAAVLQCAKAFAEEAESSKEAFGKHRLPIETLNSTIADFEAIVSKTLASKAEQANAKTGIEEARVESLKLLQRVDAVVANTLADDPTLIAEWKLRRRLGGSPGPASKTAPEAEPAQAAAS